MSIALQHLWLCDGRRDVADTAVTTGKDRPGSRTPTGTFAVNGLNRNSTLTLSNGRQYAVRYWIPFEGSEYGFHDASWQTMPYGSPHWRTRGSHGCIHMPLGAIRALFHWAHYGTPVIITRS